MSYWCFKMHPSELFYVLFLFLEFSVKISQSWTVKNIVPLLRKNDADGLNAVKMNVYEENLSHEEFNSIRSTFSFKDFFNSINQENVNSGQNANAYSNDLIVNQINATEKPSAVEESDLNLRVIAKNSSEGNISDIFDEPQKYDDFGNIFYSETDIELKETRRQNGPIALPLQNVNQKHHYKHKFNNEKTNRLLDNANIKDSQSNKTKNIGGAENLCPDSPTVPYFYSYIIPVILKPFQKFNKDTTRVQKISNVPHNAHSEKPNIQADIVNNKRKVLKDHFKIQSQDSNITEITLVEHKAAKRINSNSNRTQPST